MARYQVQDELDDRPVKSNKPRRRRASFIGFLSVITGLAAVAVVYRDNIRAWAIDKQVPSTPYDLTPYTDYLYQVKDFPIHAYHLAAGGAALAVLALLWRRVSGRTRAGWPVLGLLVCAFAAGAYRYETSPREPGSPERWVQENVVERVQKMINPTPAPVEVSTPARPTEVGPSKVVEPKPSESTGEGSRLFPEN